MFDRVLSESGEYLIDTADLDLDIGRFERLVKSVLGTYNRYSPIPKKFNWQTANLSVIQFTDDFRAPLTGELIGVPEWISSVTPVRGRSNVSPFFQGGAVGRLPGSVYNFGTVDLVDKDPTPFEYRKPNLYLAFPGLWDVKAQVYHKITNYLYDDQTADGNPGAESDLQVATIDDHNDIFFDLLQAKFLIALGRNRRAFTLQPLELTTDAAELVAEGKEQWAAAKEDLATNFATFADAMD